MSSDEEQKGKVYLNILMEIGEVLIAMIIIVTVIIAAFQTFFQVSQMIKLQPPNKEEILNLIDISVILLLALDLLRTVVVGILEKSIPIRSIIEAAMIIIVREMIVNTLVSSSPLSLIYLSISFLLITIGWVLTEKFVFHENK
ncbi:MAG: phosphate-starvation-inducible PsiE family protein [Caldisphaera sp.]|jgi:uncharacterized membrane protein (DUF373 family)|nr:phosphate-starvation-inducible PsiE family protein [Caldisphaera sp.]PMP60760.1 MAG: hypothetical protein C0201_01830 [Caldisphaera sp.]PMP91419.1 MAG: hypothetical protein C0171_02650 [Caldisphaera sp.]